MKLLYRRGIISCFAWYLLGSINGFSQVQTARPNISISARCNGFYEYLPLGYGNGNGKYPLMVFIHGLGELGNGGTDLPKVLANGPPKLINNGLFPASFTVNSQQFSFIVISPQFIDWPGPLDAEAVINYAVQHYRVDSNRIYLTGLSMGGGVVWDYAGDNSVYAHRLAAIVPISGASYPDPTGRCRVMAAANLPVWATHNLNDPTVPSWYTIDYVNGINNAVPPPTPRAKMSIFNASGHDAWSKTYDPNWVDSGMNVYQWMLLNQRNASVLPVRLSSYRAYPLGESDISISWTTSFENNNRYFILERSADAQSFSTLDTIPGFNQPSGHAYSYTDKSAFPGTDYYRLSQVDMDGRRDYFSILSVNLTEMPNTFRVNPNPAKNTLQLEFSHPEMGSLKLVLSDALGRIVKNWNFQKQDRIWRQSIDISTLPQGAYTLQLLGGSMNEIRRFIKE
jgi:hypothetical protein